MDNDFLKILRERHSVRSFKSEQIKDDELTAVLEAGTYAPTGRGMQDPWIVAVQDNDIIKQLVKMNAEVFGQGDINPYYGAPTIVLVFASKPEVRSTSLCDGTLVLGNMMNAAHAVGLGSCWIHREREMFETEEGKALMSRFGLPEGLIGVGAISLGYPADELTSIQRKPRKAGYYRVVK